MIFAMRTVLKMKYYSEKILKYWLPIPKWLVEKYPEEIINVRCCRDCEYFERDHPTINTDGNFGYCTYKTDFTVLDDEPIHWYFTDINGFCREDDIQ